MGKYFWAAYLGSSETAESKSEMLTQPPYKTLTLKSKQDKALSLSHIPLIIASSVILGINLILALWAWHVLKKLTVIARVSFFTLQTKPHRLSDMAGTNKNLHRSENYL